MTGLHRIPCNQYKEALNRRAQQEHAPPALAKRRAGGIWGRSFAPQFKPSAEPSDALMIAWRVVLRLHGSRVALFKGKMSAPVYPELRLRSTMVLSSTPISIFKGRYFLSGTNQTRMNLMLPLLIAILVGMASAEVSLVEMRS